ncbi:MAG TPA: nucleoside triphosphate pyrophosphohydrolase [Thiotrichales bacterium]|nr:nucleoside triphosphate pyrophosphohydrolase [Thiotrichales bacterium]
MTKGDNRAAEAIGRLLHIMARLRDPGEGCPWDLAQDWASLAPHTLEEAFEVVEAAESGDEAHLADELGDLLFQVVFYARIAEEEGAFSFAEVATAIADKLERRHPHVFGAEAVRDADHQTRRWEAIKAAERESKGAEGALEGVNRGLPALSRAQKLQRRAARVGFDWEEVSGVVAKVREELVELEAEMADGEVERLRAEVGDLLFSCVNLARHLEVDAEAALRQANRRFERRFRAMERILAERGRDIAEAGMAEMDAAWEEAKRREGPGEAPGN